MSIQPSPETIHNELLGELVSLYEGVKLDDLKLRALRNRAESLAKADIAGSLEVKGHLCFLEGKLNDGIGLLDRAMSLSDQRNRMFIRYMQGLEQTGFLKEVPNVFFKYKCALTGVADATRQAMNMIAAHGFMQAADELRSDLERMNVSVGEVVYSPGEQLLALSNRDGMTDAESGPVVQFVREFLYGKNVKTKKVALITITGEGDAPPAILFEFCIQADMAAAAELEWELYGQLEGHDFPIEQQRKLLFSLTSDAVEE